VNLQLKDPLASSLNNRQRRCEHIILAIASNDAYILVRRRDMPAAIVEARQTDLAPLGRRPLRMSAIEPACLQSRSKRSLPS
jgi:hypothetical protein